MDNTIFEKLFKPVSDDEMYDRMVDSFKIVRWFEDVMSTAFVPGADKMDGAVNTLIWKYIEAYPDIDWHAVTSELFEDEKTAEHAMIVAYREWKKTAQIESALKKFHDKPNI